MTVETRSLVGIAETGVASWAKALSGIVALAHHLGLSIIAEGVETHDQLGFLKDTGCEEVQGYLLAKPMNASALEAWLAHWPQAACSFQLVESQALLFA